VKGQGDGNLGVGVTLVGFCHCQVDESCQGGSSAIVGPRGSVKISSK